MVSLKKDISENEQPVREYTPVHLMDEEEAIQTFCPSKEPPAPDIEIDVKQTDKELLPPTKEEEKADSLSVWDWIKILFKSISIALLIEALTCLIYYLLLSILHIDNETCMVNLAKMLAEVIVI